MFLCSLRISTSCQELSSKSDPTEKVLFTFDPVFYKMSTLDMRPKCQFNEMQNTFHFISLVDHNLYQQWLNCFPDFHSTLYSGYKLDTSTNTQKNCTIHCNLKYCLLNQRKQQHTLSSANKIMKLNKN